MRTDPGHPEVCNICKLTKYFAPDSIMSLEKDCRAASIGCVDCKRALAIAMNRELAPLRSRRLELAENPKFVQQVMEDGACRAQLIARKTITEVKQKMGLA
jgi:tryptophanyl-tRNA synthetase